MEYPAFVDGVRRCPPEDVGAWTVSWISWGRFSIRRTSNTGTWFAGSRAHQRRDGAVDVSAPGLLISDDILCKFRRLQHSRPALRSNVGLGGCEPPKSSRFFALKALTDYPDLGRLTITERLWSRCQRTPARDSRLNPPAYGARMGALGFIAWRSRKARKVKGLNGGLQAVTSLPGKLGRNMRIAGWAESARHRPGPTAGSDGQSNANHW